MSDPKLPRPAAAEGSPSAPSGRAAGQTIVFHCPNGHRISVPTKLAGKRGACSKCGTAVVIPPASIPTPPAGHGGRPAAGPGIGLAAGDEDLIGDEGTITLKAPVPWSAHSSAPPRPSPFPDPVSPPQRAPAAGDVGLSPGAPAMPPAWKGGEGAGSAHGAPESVEPPGPGAPVIPPEGVAGGAVNPTAALVARLWAERDHGGVVELHLVGGSVILPEWYEPRWSVGSHGLFASQATDGSVTLTAVAWESIQKVVVRQVEGLPDGMFE